MTHGLELYASMCKAAIEEAARLRTERANAKRGTQAAAKRGTTHCTDKKMGRKDDRYAWPSSPTNEHRACSSSSGGGSHDGSSESSSSPGGYTSTTVYSEHTTPDGQPARKRYTVENIISMVVAGQWEMAVAAVRADFA